MPPQDGGKLVRCKLERVADVESRMLPDGTRLMKQTKRARYLALDPMQQKAFDRFDGCLPVQEVLCGLLAENPKPGIIDFYELVFHAMDDGFLKRAGDPEPEADRTLRGRRWRFGWRLLPALVSFGTFVPFGIMALVQCPAAMPVSVGGWLLVLLAMIVALSVANVLAGAVLSGFGRIVYGFGFRWKGVALPHVQVDTRDAFMGGRHCQAAVAMQAVAVPFVFALLSCLLHAPVALFASAVAAFVLTSPFGDAPMHSLLHAVLRNAYALPKCGSDFLNGRFFQHLLQPRRRLKEEAYLIVFSIYALAWLGAVLLFVARLWRRHGDVLIQDVLFGPLFSVRLIATLALGLLGVMLLAPIACQFWLLCRNVWGVFAPLRRSAESRLGTRVRSGNRPQDMVLADFLKGTILFEDQSDDMRLAVVRHMQYVVMADGTPVMREHERGDALFVVYAGKVMVRKEDEYGASRVAATLGPGDVFGEIALLDDVPRTATVQAVGRAALLMLHRTAFEKLLVDTMGADRLKFVVQICNFLRRNALFADWPNSALLGLAREFERVDIAKGETIIRRGETNVSFFLIYEGHCMVRIEDGRSVRIGPGEFFGEISLLKGIPAIADVQTETACRCLRMGRERFIRFVTQDVLTGVIVERAMQSRLDEAF